MRKDRRHAPRIATWLIKRFFPKEDVYFLTGDFKEIYWDILDEKGWLSAFFWYWSLVVASVPYFVFDTVYWRIAMFRNYLKIAFRNIRTNRLNSGLNIAGLALGISSSLLIFFHVKYELNYEECFPKADRIYRITINSKYGDTYRHWAVGPVPMGPMMQEEIPEIELSSRFRRIGSVVLSYDPVGGPIKRFEEDGGFYTDPQAVEMFDLKFIEGDPGRALNEDYSIIITASMAEKYFGKEDPINKSLMSENSGSPYRVTGVIEELPPTSHLQFDYLVSMSTFYHILNERDAQFLLDNRTWKAVYTYVLIEADHEKDVVESKLSEFRERFHRDLPTREETFYLQPVKNIHLHSKLEQEMSRNSDIVYVYIFSFAALLILVVACVNFINITTAQALKRMKEVGVRKVLGAQKRQLIHQFLGESFIITILAAAVSLVLFRLSIPFYNNLSGKSIHFNQLISVSNILVLHFIIFGIGLMTGIYPAFFISNFRPVNTLKGMKDPQSSVSLVRKGLIIFQFVISIFLVFSTITIYRQLLFFRERNLGFDEEKLVAVQLYGDLYRGTVGNRDALKAELLKNAAISRVSLASNLPGERFSVEHLRPEGIPDDEDIPTVRVIRVDEDFLKTLDIELMEGQNFRKSSSEESQFLLSEMAVEALELKDPIARKARGISGEGQIVGIFKDFHFASLHHQIEPLVLDYRPDRTQYLLVKFRGMDIRGVLEYIEDKLNEVAPDHLFMYTFVDDRLNRLYAFEAGVSDIFKVFSSLAIFISCLGLFGLSVYSAELRVKEIGVRKVLGASASSLITLLAKENMKWVFIANVIAWPMGYFAMNEWLHNFAYRINIHVWTFVLTGLLAFIVAFSTVSYQAVKAAMSNPVHSLRYE